MAQIYPPSYSPLVVRGLSHDLFEHIETQVKFTYSQDWQSFRQIVNTVNYLDTSLIVVRRESKDENIVISGMLNLSVSNQL
jgi:serine/threonine protein kinase